jgi:hypothetical protein
VAEWLTIEVLDAEAFPASSWQDAHCNDLVEAAVTHGPLLRVAGDSVGSSWSWSSPPTRRWSATAACPVVASLDAVPDQVRCLMVYRGRGGGAGVLVPRRPRPKPVAMSAEWPAPVEFRFLAVEHAVTDLVDDATDEELRSIWHPAIDAAAAAMVSDDDAARGHPAPEARQELLVEYYKLIDIVPGYNLYFVTI